MLDAACAWKLGAWAFSVLAAGLRAGDFEFASLLAHVGGHSVEAGEALKGRPRDVLRSATERGAKRIEQEHRDWLSITFAGKPAARAEAAGTIEAQPFVLKT